MEILTKLFGAVTWLSYRLRFVFLIAAAALTVAAVYWGFVAIYNIFIPYFALFIASLWAALSGPAKWKRMLYERKYFYRNDLTAFGALYMVPYLFVWLLIGAASLFFIALFTLPIGEAEIIPGEAATRSVFEFGSQEFRWTISALVLTGIVSIIITKGISCLIAYRPGRVALFLAPLMIGVLYSATIETMASISRCEVDDKDGLCRLGWATTALVGDAKSDNGQDYLFPPPNEADVIKILKGFFGDALIADQIERLKGEASESETLYLNAKTRIETQRNALSGRKDVVISLVPQMEKFCRSIGVKAVPNDIGQTRCPSGGCGYRPWQSGDSSVLETKLAGFEGCDGLNPLLAIGKFADRVRKACSIAESAASLGEDGIQEITQLRQQSWNSAQCGYFVGQSYCKHLKSENDGEAPDHCKKPVPSLDDVGEVFDGAIADLDRAAGVFQSSGNSTIYDSGDEPPQVTGRNITYVYALLDSYIAARILDAIDLGRGAGFNISRVEDLTSLVDQSVDFDNPAAEALAKRKKAEQEQAAFDSLRRLGGPCQEALKPEFQSSISATFINRPTALKKWCAGDNSVRSLVRIVLSPNILQGYVISVFVSLFFFVFRPKDAGDPDPRDFSLIGRVTRATAEMAARISAWAGKPFNLLINK